MDYYPLPEDFVTFMTDAIQPVRGRGTNRNGIGGNSGDGSGSTDTSINGDSSGGSGQKRDGRRKEFMTEANKRSKTATIAQSVQKQVQTPQNGETTASSASVLVTNYRCVEQQDPETHRILHRYESITSAAKSMELTEDGIGRCCRKIQPTYAGFKWLYCNAQANGK